MDKQSETGKKSWHKPELTILVRNKPEETVLLSCKTMSSATGYLNMASRCAWFNKTCFNCDIPASS